MSEIIDYDFEVTELISNVYRETYIDLSIGDKDISFTVIDGVFGTSVEVDDSVIEHLREHLTDVEFEPSTNLAWFCVKSQGFIDYMGDLVIEALNDGDID